MSKPYCIIPFHGINIRSDGSFRTCCSSIQQDIKDDKNKPIQITDENGIEKAFNSPELKKLRLDLLNDNREGFQKHCGHCIHQQSIGVRSVRIRHNMFYEDDKIKVETDGTVQVEQLKHIDTRMDTKCDQACIMCGPFSSSMWEKEYRSSKKDWSNTEMDQEIEALDSHSTKRIQPKTITDIIDKLENFDQLEFRGGEPLVDKKVLDVLDYCIEKDIAKNIHLSLVTNTQNLTKEVVDKLVKFKGGRIRCSVDSIGKKNEYHRYHSNWAKIEEGLKQITRLSSSETPKPTDKVFKDKWIIVVLPTLTVYNCLQWIEYWEFFDAFFNEYDIRAVLSCNSVKNRPSMYHTLIDQEVRLKYVEEFKKVKEHLSLLDWNDSYGEWNRINFDKLCHTLSEPTLKNKEKHLEEFRKWTQRIEKNRSQKLYDYYPELKGIIDV
tara:strand:+ start:429 stop:1736 length:1308 start_codon:yes stop_codon:yes gene_type:complete